ncbi:hypothetical protein HEB29_002207 [Streptomyces fulvorobeus]|uniref:Transposase n=1 Tax=Streptomyces fulvorobeus TaxID=284028 RepID=A0A7Y9HB24_9ACTN|nr:hypothetical protein [Streptomyces fulvorobeus]
MRGQRAGARTSIVPTVLPCGGSISDADTAVLVVKGSTAEHLADLLRGHRIEAGTRTGRRAGGCFRQAVLVLRWFLDGARLVQLSCDIRVSVSTAYRCLHEELTVPAAGGRTSPPRWSARKRPG